MNRRFRWRRGDATTLHDLVRRARSMVEQYSKGDAKTEAQLRGARKWLTDYTILQRERNQRGR